MNVIYYSGTCYLWFCFVFISYQDESNEHIREIKILQKK